jgi:hypothetical protein
MREDEILQDVMTINNCCIEQLHHENLLHGIQELHRAISLIKKVVIFDTGTTTKNTPTASNTTITSNKCGDGTTTTDQTTKSINNEDDTYQVRM